MIKEFLDNLRSALLKACIDLNYPTENLEINLEVPKDKNHGDYSTNIAMKLVRLVKMPPMKIAENIVERLNKEELHLSALEIANPAFINFTIDPNYLLGVINLINDNSNYGSLNIGEGKKINIEYVSANPTGYLHIGHGRGAAFGDSLANIMKKCGYDVTREYYVNDAGNQIKNMALSVYERYKELFGLEAHMGEDYYLGKEIIDIAKIVKEEFGDKYLNNFDLEFFKEYGTLKLLENLKKDLERFNVHFDVWSSEKSLYKNHAVQNVIVKLKDLGYLYEQDGAVFLKTSMFKDEKDRVIIKSDGSYTYFLPDIAYHADKIARGYDHLIDVLGADHHGYVDRLKAAVSMIGGNSDMIDVELLQMVRVLENGEEVKMSKRSGRAITLIDLIDEVGSDALRYFYAQKALSTHMDLDLTIMKEKSNDNPVFYCQYAYARCASLFRKYQDKYGEFKAVTSFKQINLNSVKDICLILLKYPTVLKEACEKRLVHKVIQYIDELAYELHSFYNDEKIITDDLNETLEKLTILKALQSVLKDALALCGINVYEQM